MWHNAYIRYFDNLTGIGVVTVPGQGDFKLHWSAACDPQHFWDFFTAQSLDRVRVKIFCDSHFSQIDKLEAFEWCTEDDLRSDIILNILEAGDRSSGTGNWFDFCLNNFLPSKGV